MNSPNAKGLILGILTIIAGIANAYSWKRVLLQGEFQNATFYSLPVLALFLFAVLFALSSVFIRSAFFRSLAAVLSLAAGYLLIPYQPFLLSAAAATAFGGWYAAEQIANEAAVANFFSVRRVLRSGLPVFFTVVALVLAVFYFSLVSGGKNQVLFPRSLFDASVPLLQGPLQTLLPGFRPNASVDELLLALAAQQLDGAVDPSRLGRAEREALLSQGRHTLSEQFGVKLTGQEKITDILYRVTNIQVAKFLGPYRSYLPFIAAAGFFIAIKTFTLPVYWLTLILTFVVVKFLLATGFLKKEKTTIEVERINL